MISAWACRSRTEIACAKSLLYQPPRVQGAVGIHSSGGTGQAIGLPVAFAVVPTGKRKRTRLPMPPVKRAYSDSLANEGFGTQFVRPSNPCANNHARQSVIALP